MPSHTQAVSAHIPSVTMSSLEIAELTGKRHNNVLRDIRDMLDEIYGDGGVLKTEQTPDGGVLKNEETPNPDLLSFEDTYTDPQNGQTYSCYRLDKRHTMLLITGYSAKLRLAVLDRLEELEQIVIRHQTLASYLPPQLSIREKRQAVKDFYALAKDFRKDGLSQWDARMAANYSVVTATGHDELGLTTDMPFSRDVAAGLSGFGDPEHAALNLMSRRTLERALARTVDTTGKMSFEVENWLCERLDAISYSRIPMGRLTEALTLLKVYREFNAKPALQSLLAGVAQ